MRVSVITGSYGAGHDVAAHRIADVLRAAGCTVAVQDVVPLLPWRLGPMLKSVYYAQLRRRPGSWDTTLRLVEPGRLVHRFAMAMFKAMAGPVLEAVEGSDLIITTHPFGAQILGQTRLDGRLEIPVVTYLTDTSVHALWVHPGVDHNLAIHQVAAEEVKRWGGGRTTVVRPLVDDVLCETGEAPPQADPLAVHEIVGPRALVTGGSLGMGQLEKSARDILATGLMTPVVLCGTDERLRRRLGMVPGVVALGWREDVRDLMMTSDCIVQNAGGCTSLEALASGAPVITYRPLPGHGVANSRNLDRAGLIPWARGTDELALLLAAAHQAPRVNRLWTSAPTILDVLVASSYAVAVVG